MNVMIVAAGTGGHITPGISIANKIKKEEKDCNIVFVGTKNGMENDIISKEGYDIVHIRAQGIKREFTIENIRRVIQLVLGIGDAKKVIKKFNPDIVIGTGGYVTFPIFKVATKMGIPTVLHESNSIPGKVVTMMANRVDTIMIGFEKAKEKIKNANNILYTGTPTKMSTYVPPSNLREKLGLKEDLPVLLITGGSQGAKKLNEQIVNIITDGIEKKYQIVFVTGSKQYNDVRKAIQDKRCNVDEIPNLHILNYVYNMEEYMSVADVIISRAGALSLTEICIMGIPSIIIPYPFAAENHQVYNAQVIKNAGAGEVIIESELTTEKLNNILESMIYNKEKLAQMRKQAKSLAVLNVEDKIYTEVKRLVNMKGKKDE